MANEPHELELLRVAFAAALKYHFQYGQSPRQEYWSLWRTILTGGKLPAEISLNTVAGDVFAFWYTELGLDSSEYLAVVSQFFTER